MEGGWLGCIGFAMGAMGSVGDRAGWTGCWSPGKDEATVP